MLRNIAKLLNNEARRHLNTSSTLLAGKQKIERKYAAALALKPQVSDFLLEPTQIDEAVRCEPSLATASADLWQRSHETFVNHGLETIQFLRIVTGNPSVLQRSPARIREALEYWRSCQFGEKSLHLLLTKYPELLDVTDGRRLVKHVTFLQGYTSSNRSVWRLLMNCPDLLEQSEETISMKIDYIQNVMRIEITEIVKAEALSKTLEEIRYRHVFLERLGLFTPRPLKADPNEPTKNPRLYQITDTSEKTFATKICHVSLAEFEAFKELYKRERERKQRKEDAEEEEDFD